MLNSRRLLVIEMKISHDDAKSAPGSEVAASTKTIRSRLRQEEVPKAAAAIRALGRGGVCRRVPDLERELDVTNASPRFLLDLIAVLQYISG